MIRGLFLVFHLYFKVYVTGYTKVWYPHLMLHNKLVPGIIERTRVLFLKLYLAAPSASLVIKV